MSSSSSSSPPLDAATTASVVALVVSAIALVGTTAQVFQQYLASASGYSSCDESVMGEWYKSRRRKFRWSELRIEVQFEAPVIFVAPPTNKKGPVEGVPDYIDGTDTSLQKTRTLLPGHSPKQGAVRKDGVHTADNERATWWTMLSELQLMERESHEWQQTMFNHGPPREGALAGFSSHTLAVAVQAKKRSFDTMPSSVKKPYATSAISHIVELAAMLGLYWKEFDRSKDKYRAEGNGYVLTGTGVSDLGLLFTFQVCGKSRFAENRVIPVDEVKELCFGFVSTIFRQQQDFRRLEFPNEEPMDLSILQLGSLNEIAETLVLIGCNTKTGTYIRDNTKKHGHLFPGMASALASPSALSEFFS
jgi:hypothetical protein